MSSFIAVAVTMYVLQMSTPQGDVRDLSRHSTPSSCVAERDARHRADRRVRLNCVPIRIEGQVGQVPHHPRAYPQPYPQRQAHPYREPYRGEPPFRHNNSLEVSPYYNGAPIQYRNHENTQRWHQSWENGRIGCISPRQCL